MSRVQHHPPEDILMDHAIGRLKRGPGLVMEEHLCACPACRAEIERMEAVGGALLEDMAPAETSPDALARILARIEAPEPPRPSRPPPPAGLEGIDLSALLGDLPIGRRRWLAPGVWIRPLLSEPASGASTYLLRGGPGVKLLQHGHAGQEFTCVLKGAYRDQTGRYGPGDFQYAAEDLDHGPVAEPDGECICLISAEGPMQMHSLIGRIMQPFVGL